jgi:hypothetical protein
MPANVYIPKYLKIPGISPGLLIDVCDISAWDSSGIINPYVRYAGCFDKSSLALAGGEIKTVNFNIHTRIISSNSICAFIEKIRIPSN